MLGAPAHAAGPDEVTYTLGIHTCNTSGAGTDGDVEVRLNENIGNASRVTPYTTLDHAHYNDFERNDYDQYEIKAPKDFRPGRLEIRFNSSDQWCFDRITVWKPGPNGEGTVKSKKTEAVDGREHYFMDNYEQGTGFVDAEHFGNHANLFLDNWS